jgi:predicted membrane protein
VILLPIVWWFHAVDLTWWDGIGEERFVVDELEELEDEYRYGIGQLVVDLTDLDLEGETRELAVGLTIGEVIVMVPDDIEVVIDADGRIGEVLVDGPIALSDEGFDAHIDTTFGDADGGTLELDLDVGLGSGKVQVEAR